MLVMESLVLNPMFANQDSVPNLSADLNLNEPDTIEVYIQSMEGMLIGLGKEEEVQYDLETLDKLRRP